jgi:hypothetical protein
MKEDNLQLIPFSRYYNEMSKDDKRDLLSQILVYITATHFYACVRKNKFTVLIREKIETITKQKFDWNETV